MKDMREPTPVHEGAQYAVPTLGQRLRWALGYRKRFGPEFVDNAPGYWAKTVIIVRFDWPDRLRLLLTGAVEIDVEHRTDKPIDTMESVSAVSLIGPGDERLRKSDSPPLPAAGD